MLLKRARTPVYVYTILFAYAADGNACRAVFWPSIKHRVLLVRIFVFSSFHLRRDQNSRQCWVFIQATCKQGSAGNCVSIIPEMAAGTQCCIYSKDIEIVKGPNK